MLHLARDADGDIEVGRDFWTRDAKVAVAGHPVESLGQRPGAGQLTPQGSGQVPDQGEVLLSEDASAGTDHDLGCGQLSRGAGLGSSPSTVVVGSSTMHSASMTWPGVDGLARRAAKALADTVITAIGGKDLLGLYRRAAVEGMGDDDGVTVDA